MSTSDYGNSINWYINFVRYKPSSHCDILSKSCVVIDKVDIGDTRNPGKFTMSTFCVISR
jgi:hypothetical protein